LEYFMAAGMRSPSTPLNCGGTSLKSSSSVHTHKVVAAQGEREGKNTTERRVSKRKRENDKRQAIRKTEREKGEKGERERDRDG
jgi:hypothetical protein